MGWKVWSYAFGFRCLTRHGDGIVRSVLLLRVRSALDARFVSGANHATRVSKASHPIPIWCLVTLPVVACYTE